MTLTVGSYYYNVILGALLDMHLTSVNCISKCNVPKYLHSIKAANAEAYLQRSVLGIAMNTDTRHRIRIKRFQSLV